MNELEKKLLARKLSCKKPPKKVTVEYIDKISKIFDYVVNVYFEGRDYADKYIKMRYDFAKKPSILHTHDDALFLSIFIRVMTLYDHNVINYLDYGLFKTIYLRNGVPGLNALYETLSDMVEIAIYDEDRDNYIYQITTGDNGVLQVLDYVLRNHYEDTQESEFVTDNYREVMAMFKSIMDQYHEIENDYDNDYYFLFNQYMNMVYFYAIINNLIVVDKDNFMKFLERIKDNMRLIIDKLYFIDDEYTSKKLMPLIDEEYKNPSVRINIR